MNNNNLVQVSSENQRGSKIRLLLL